MWARDAAAAAHSIEAGQAAERAGHRQEARAHFEAAIYQTTGNAAASQISTVLRWITRTHLADGDTDAAMDCAVAALAVVEATGDRTAQGHAIAAKAAVHWAQGDLDTAERLYLVARTSALAAGERSAVAMTSANLGIIAAVRGDLWEALHHYNVGLENYRALDRHRDVCAVLNNMGRLHTDLRRWADAERAYAEAVVISEAIGDRATRIGLEVNVAEMWLSRGDASRATEAVNVAATLSADVGDAAWLGQIAKLRGMLRRDAGAPNESERFFATAIERAEARQDVLLLAETLRERAGLYRGQGRNREALQSLNRAHRLFTHLRAKRDLASIDQSVSRLEDDFLGVVGQWGESIEAKDRYTQGHCERVADLACAIASACGMDNRSLFWFRIGALLHDVGKLVVPSEVLNKPGKLTEEEWTLLRTHPTVGVDMVAGIDFPWDVRPIIESHHERWDGNGYPYGLAGVEIPLSARILAVADVYDALTSVRSYKAAMQHEAAMEIMRREIGGQFDPQVFARFEEVMREWAINESKEIPSRVGARDVVASSPAIEPFIGDPLTGLPSRESMERIAGQALADRNLTNAAVSLLVLEVDLDAGATTALHHRRALRWIARALRNVTRTSDFVARTGERQFMALLPDSTYRQAETVMRRIEATLSNRWQTGPLGSRAGAGIRMAVVAAPAHGATVAELFANAGRAVAWTDPALPTRSAL